jgi:hypothetical protein
MKIIERLAAEAIRRGASLLDIEYKEGYEDVVAAQGRVGYGIARFRSSSPEAITLREELHRIAKRKHRITVDGCQYELRGSIYESFGEDAFRVQLRRV